MARDEVQSTELFTHYLGLGCELEFFKRTILRSVYSTHILHWHRVLLTSLTLESNFMYFTT